ncbi:MAG TPA: DUF5995 family protein [Solirubrobacteraceae bacterium]|nr:DUF5995 family protein [Solirubrobacteraceae bacterium]
MRAGTVSVLLVAVLALAAAPAAPAEDPPLVNWPALLPALAPPFTESTFDICPDASPRCLDATLAEMRRRLIEHDAACSDTALFVRNYQLVTRFYQRFAGTGFFADDAYVAREDAIFAQLYFDAEDAWRRGEHDRVPEAWRIAFEAADRKEVQGAGNLLLGINGHVQRDQPYMIAGLGLVDPQGRSRKPDHDKFNELLNTAYDDVIAQAVEWDDPDLAMYEVPGTQADNLALFQIIASWREGVWRNAERLVRARSDEERRLVAESIERNAAEWARWIREEFRYRGPFTRANRDALCAKRAERAAADRAALARDGAPPRRVACTALPAFRVRGDRIVARSPCGGRIAIFRVTGDRRCQFVTARGGLGAPRSCGRPRWAFARVGTFRTKALPPGRYVARGGGGTWRLRVRRS